MLGRSKQTKEITDYTSAKEIIRIKLMEIQVNCIDEEKEFSIVEIAKGMEEDKNITIEKYYNKEEEEETLIKDETEKNLINLKGIIVSVNQYSKYKFLIGESCEIERVTVDEIKENTKIEELEILEEFEEKLLEKTQEDNGGDNNEEDDGKEENNINGYVKEGLILYLDGIDKIKDDNSEVKNGIWYDLSDSANNATLYNCTNNSNNIGFNGSSSYAALPTKALGNYGPSTIEVVLKAENEAAVLGDNNSISRRGLYIWNNHQIISTVGNNADSQDTYSHTTSLNLYSNQHTYTLLFDGINYDNTNVYIDMQKANQAAKSGCSNFSTYPVVGRRIMSQQNQWWFRGNIYAIRVYNRQLTQDELTQNHNIDKNRFGF